MRTHFRIPKRSQRRGSLYIAVLGTTMIVAMIALAAMQVARLNLRATTGGTDAAEAQLLADSAVEMALAMINNQENWRTLFASNVEFPATAIPLGRGTITWRIVENGETALRLDGIGRVGEVVRVQSVDLVPTGNVGLTSLTSALHAEGDITLDDVDDTIIANGGPISTSGQLIGGGTVNGAVEVNSDKEMPDPETVFDYYLTQGTLIPTDGDFDLRRVLLSPFSNPYGATNPEGIYIIDCQGARLRIRECRIVGTLVVLNPDSDSMIEDSVNWEPAYPNYPALLVDGDWAITLADESFKELGVNLNPPGTPYQGASANLPDDKWYASGMGGLVYVSGNLTFLSGQPNIQGVVVVGGRVSLIEEAALTLTYEDTFFLDPPPGFAGGEPTAISPDSWKRRPSN